MADKYVGNKNKDHLLEYPRVKRLAIKDNIFRVDAIVDFEGNKVWGRNHLINIHDVSQCNGRPCAIHHPSDHMMREWPLVWNKKVGRMSRICPHWHEHPDPDDAAYWWFVTANHDKYKHNCCSRCFHETDYDSCWGSVLDAWRQMS